MASKVPSTAVAKRKEPADMALMPPPPPPKKIKRPPVVLDEDVYTDALSHIIARDFFPGLLETQAQQDYMDALDSRNDEWIHEAGQNLKATMTPGPAQQGKASITQTPATVASTLSPGRTPQPGRGNDTPKQAQSRQAPSQPAVDLTLSLQAFQAKYTSEDNDSFNGVLDAQNLAKAQKYAHLRNHTNILPSKQRIAQHTVKAQKLLAAPPGSDLIPRPSQDLSLRPASYDSFPVRQGGKNSFMFNVDGVESSDPRNISEQAEANSKAPLKATNFLATRLPAPETTVPESPSLSAIDAAIAGRPRLSTSEIGSTIGSISGSETPRVNGWAFVDEEPTAAEIAATTVPREDLSHLLPKADISAGPSFKMSGPSRREDIHRGLVDKAAQREKEKLATRSSKSGGMTPAARSLAGKLGTPIRGDLFGVAGKDRQWTPMRTPMRKK